MRARRAFSTVVVTKPLNIVLAKIISALDFNENKGLVADILHAMLCTKRNHEYLACSVIVINIVERKSCTSGNDYPVFFPSLVTLIRESRSWDGKNTG